MQVGSEVAVDEKPKKSKESDNESEDEQDTNDTEDQTKTERKKIMEERWLKTINNGKHCLSPEENERSVRSRSLSEHM